jgi:hypothetical protein
LTFLEGVCSLACNMIYGVIWCFPACYRYRYATPTPSPTGLNVTPRKSVESASLGRQRKDVGGLCLEEKKGQFAQNVIKENQLL